MKKKSSRTTTVEKAGDWEVVSPILKAVYAEIKDLSKKKQDEHLNILKVRKLNKVLDKCGSVLKDEKSAYFLDMLDEDDLPTNSDAVLILAQYDAAMDQFRSAYHGFSSVLREHVWFTEGVPF